MISVLVLVLLIGAFSVAMYLSARQAKKTERAARRASAVADEVVQMRTRRVSSHRRAG